MNKTIKTILVIAGILLLLYGGYELIMPESSVDIGIAEFETQNNNNAYTVLGIGTVVLLLGLFVGKK